MISLPIESEPDNELLHAALAFAAKGWRVLPCHTVDSEDRRCSCGSADCGSVGKHPLTPRGCHDATTDADTIRQWWTEAAVANVGIATGRESGLFVLDCDGAAGLSALAKLEDQHGPLPKTLSIRTGGGGRHFYFRYPPNCAVGNRAKLGGLPIDVRGDGGYVLAPPSLHKSGNRYTIEVDADLVDAPGSLLDFVAPLESAPNPTPSLSTNGAASLVLRVGGGADVTSRARAYLAKTPPAISGQGGHAATFTAACALVQGFSLSPSEAMPLLAEWNTSCVPPWSEKELLHKLADAEKAAPPPGKARGYLLGDKVPSSAPTITTTISIPAPPPARLIEVEPYRPFPTDALPDVARAFVVEGAAALGCDPAYLALPTLAALAGLIGNARTIRIKRSWSEPAIVWVGIVGDSGTLKSPALDLALRPIHAIQAEHRAAYAEAVKGQLDADQEYKRALKEWERSKSKAKPPEKPAEPICRRALASDVTIERLAKLLSENPRGLLVARDELAGWFVGLTRYRSGGASDAPHWLELHRAGTLVVDRVKEGGSSIIVRRAAVSLVGGIQPAVLAKTLTAEHLDSGMAARFLLAMPPRRIKRWTEADISQSVHDDYAALLRRLIDLPIGNDGRGEPEPISLRMTPEAKAEWVRFYGEWAKEQAELDGELAAAWSKLEGYAARLALIHHVATTADAGAADAVGLESLRAGITLTKWFAAEARRIYQTLGEPKEERELRRLIEHVRALGGSATPRDLQRSNGKRYRTATDAMAALQTLVAAGLGQWVTIVPPPKRGDGVKFVLNACPTSDVSDIWREDEPAEAETLSDTCPTSADGQAGNPCGARADSSSVGHVGLSDSMREQKQGSASLSPPATLKTHLSDTVETGRERIVL